MVIDKKVKVLGYAVIAVFMLSYIAFAVATGVQRHKINEYKEALTTQCAITDSLNRTVNQLWGQECIRVENHIEVVQKGIVNTTAANNISRSVSEITRGELLMAMDSLNYARTQGK